MNPIRPARLLGGRIVVESAPLLVGSNVYRGVDVGIDIEPRDSGTRRLGATTPYRLVPPLAPSTRPIPVIVRQRNVTYSEFAAATLTRYRMSAPPAPRLLCGALALRQHVVASVEEFVCGVTLEEVLRHARARGERMPVPIALAIAHGLAPLWMTATSRPPQIDILVDPAALLLDSMGRVRALPDYARRPETDADDDDIERVLFFPGAEQRQRFLPYAAPEQLRGPELDVRTGMFTLGLLLYEMIAGAHPFASTAATSVEIAPRMARDVPPLSQRRFDVVPGVLDLVHRCLARSPSGRFASWREFGSALAAVQALFPATGPDEIAGYVRTDLAMPIAQEIQLDLDPNAWRAFPSPGYHIVWLPEALLDSADTV